MLERSIELICIVEHSEHSFLRLSNLRFALFDKSIVVKLFPLRSNSDNSVLLERSIEVILLPSKRNVNNNELFSKLMDSI